ncbi:MAG TPA: HTTM domain-containing protein, partial [Planctomycetota bacterium]|nr:HTTM domain-containing protein [Planctomycetota bacterium]
MKSSPRRPPGEALFRPLDNAWLVFFRIAFGLLMFEEAMRYLLQGLATSLYIDPRFHFTYFGFAWVRPWPGEGISIHFALQGLLALGIAAGAL